MNIDKQNFSKKNGSKNLKCGYLIIAPLISIALIGCGGGGGGSGGGPSVPEHRPNQNPNVVIPNNNHPNNQRGQNIAPQIAPINPLAHENRISGVSLGEEKIEKQSLVDRKHDENKIMNVAIMDTFFYRNHKFIKDDGSSRIDIKNQPDMINADKTEHGTMVASVFADHNKNAKIFAYRTGIDRGGLRISTSSDQFQNAHDNGVRIFNNSYGTYPIQHSGASAPFDNVAKFAREDSIFIWAAGNETENNASPQSLYPKIDRRARNGWIAVMAVANENDTVLAPYSNKIGSEAKEWGITAKGNWSIEYEKGRTVYEIGTSFATPIVTAAVANVWDKFPWMDNHLVTMTILSSANRPGTSQQTEGPDDTFGWGILNEQRALKGPGRLDKRLFTDREPKSVLNDLFVVNFDYKDYKDKSKLTWANDMAGNAGIHKKGTGTLYLDGANTYTAATWVEEGAIVISKSLLNSKVAISKNGTFATENENEKVKMGYGKRPHFPYIVTNNGGSLNVYGKGLRIDGDYEGKNGGRIVVDIDKSNLEITGTMDMGNDGYVLADVKDIQSVPKAQTQTKKIITANEIKNYDGRYKVSPNISKYINLSAFYMDKQKRNIYAEYNRNSTQYVLKASGHLNASSSNTARNLDIVLDDIAEQNQPSQISNAAVKLMTAKAHLLPQMIDSLSGEIHSSSQNMFIKQNQAFNKTLSSRIASLMYSEKSGFWLEGIYAENNIKKEGYASTKAKTKGSWLGADAKLTDEMTLGLALNKSDSKAQFKEPFGNIQSKNTGVAIYGSYEFTNFYLLNKLGVNLSKNEVERTILDNSSKTSYRSKIYNIYTELGNMMKFQNILINPFLTSEYSKISRGGFEENVAFGLISKKKYYNSASFTAGLRAETSFDKFNISSSISHTYTPNPNDFKFDAEFNGSSKNIKIQGISESRNTTWTSFGISYKASKNFTIDSKYNLSIENEEKDNGIFSIGGIYKF